MINLGLFIKKKKTPNRIQRSEKSSELGVTNEEIRTDLKLLEAIGKERGNDKDIKLQNSLKRPFPNAQTFLFMDTTLCGLPFN